MARLQCDIIYRKGKPVSVKWTVLGVQRSDTILFTSNYPNTAIENGKGSPFSGPSVIPIGSKKELKVTKAFKGPYKVVCGTLANPVGKAAGGFVPWPEGGFDLP
jgi:hypothetical protein